MEDFKIVENQRLKVIFGLLRFTERTEFAELIGVKARTFGNYFNMATEQPFELWLKIKKRFPQVNGDWVLSGEGAPLLDDSKQDSTDTLLDTFESSKLKLNESNLISTKKNYEVKGDKNVFESITNEVNEARGDYKSDSRVLQMENEMLRKRIAELEGLVADLKEDKRNLNDDKKALNVQIALLQEALTKK